MHVAQICRQTWFVQQEMALAMDILGEIPAGQIYIIPVMFEPCDIPESIRHIPWFDLSDERQSRHLFDAMHVNENKTK